MKKIIIFGLIIFAVLFKYYLFLENTPLDKSNDFCQFRVESAVRYHYAKLVSEGKSIPDIDERAQWPEGLRVKDRIKLTTEYTAGIIYRFIPRDIPFHIFLIYFMLFVSAFSAVSAFLLSEKLSGNKYFALIASVFFITSLPFWARTAIGGFVEEDFALPFIFLSFYFFLKAFDGTGKKRLYAGLSALFMLIPLTSWHLTQFYYLLFIVFLIIEYFLRYKEKDKIIFPFLFLTCFNFVGGLLFPTLRSESFIFSYGMLVSYALLISWYLSGKFAFAAWKSLLLFLSSTALFFGLFSFFTRNHAGEYGHVYALLKYKILYFGAKPDDPTSMPFDAKVFWQAGFVSPQLKSIVVAFLGLLIVSVPGFIIAVKKIIKRTATVAEEGLVFFASAFFVLYLLFERLYVFEIFFLVPFIPALFNFRLLKDEKKERIAVYSLISAALAFQLYAGLSFDIKQRDVGIHNEAVKWFKDNTKEDDAVLANFGVSAVIFAFAERPVALHPMFESADIRKKTKDFYETIFSSEEDFYKLCGKYKVKYFLFDWHMVFDKSKNSIRYQVNNTSLSKKSAAVTFLFYPEKLKHFSLLYQNTYYRIYKINAPGEKPYIASGIEYKPFFNPKLFIMDEKDENLKDGYIKARMDQIWSMPQLLAQAAELRRKGDNVSAEKLYKEIISYDPYFPDARVTLAEFYIQTGRLNEAANQCVQAIRMDPGLLNAYYFLSQVYFKAGDKNKCILVLKEALKVSPGNQNILEMLRSLQSN